MICYDHSNHNWSSTPGYIHRGVQKTILSSKFAAGKYLSRQNKVVEGTIEMVKLGKLDASVIKIVRAPNERFENVSEQVQLSKLLIT